ncbi:hypothetical protein V520_11505 [Pseudomonas putida KG-4]|nr:hypothetical protein V520_11505 [Pseudomonas putida KG-4]
MLDHEGIASIAFENETDYKSIAFYGDNRVVFYRWNRDSNSSVVEKKTLDDWEFLANLIQAIEQL